MERWDSSRVSSTCTREKGGWKASQRTKSTLGEARVEMSRKRVENAEWTMELRLRQAEKKRQHREWLLCDYL